MHRILDLSKSPNPVFAFGHSTHHRLDWIAFDLSQSIEANHIGSVEPTLLATFIALP
jgi:hypothetical protein